MSKILFLSNPGIGDATWLNKDKQLKEILARFPADSHVLIRSTMYGTMCCGGYNYRLELVAGSNVEAIEKAIAPLGFNNGQAVEKQQTDEENCMKEDVKEELW
jgi:hypothetical protein